MNMVRARAGATRRQFMRSAGLAVLPSAVLASGMLPLVAPSLALADHGRVDPPVPAPDIPLMLHDGRSMSLSALLARRVSAIALMFTSCTSTCPIQGAIFRRVQELLPDHAARGIQLVSLTVDPEHDTPAALAKWLQGFRARPGWVGAAPQAQHVERVRKFAGAGGNPADNHSTRVQIVNRDALLIWRTYELPEAEDIAGILQKV